MIKFLLLLSFYSALLSSNYVGDQTCLNCHKQEHKAWSGSDHDLAMQKADTKSVLGNFNNATFNYDSLVSTFYKKGGKFMVRTDGADGKLHDYEISYTFGVYPLQQYMIDFPDGKIQVLSIAWDARPKKEGGQRWFHIHADENVTSKDVLHWTGPNQNWNYMCADCHSTHFQKNYDSKSKKYASTYKQINVSCEACHGAGSEHIVWAKDPKKYKGTLKSALAFTGHRNQWEIDTKTQKPLLKNPISRKEVMVCAKCHSRRTQFGDDFDTLQSYHDNYRLATLSENLYEADGKIKDEVYVYGSFAQSKMYKAGVTCSDCHDSHSLKRRAVGDNVCNKCHLRNNYATPKHTHHKTGSANCISCHMPSRTYMGVDVRNDHSFRVPRPDLSATLHTTNACNNCHKDQTPQKMANALKQWNGKTPKGYQEYAHALHSNRINSKTAYQDLYHLITSSAPDIAKATLVPRLGVYPSRQTHVTSLQMLRSLNPTIRIAALQALERFPAQFVLKDIFNTLNDDVKSVRIEAMRILLNYDTGTLPPQQQKLYDKVFKEYKDALFFLSDRAETQVALAGLYEKTQEYDKAERAYKEALRIQKQYLPSYINYAHFYQQQGREDEALKLMLQAEAIFHNEPLFIEPLALWYIKNGQKDKGISLLKKVALKYPKNARIQYLYAVSIGDKNVDDAITVLEHSLTYHSGDLAVLNALIYYYKVKNDPTKSHYYEEQIKNLTKIEDFTKQ